MDNRRAGWVASWSVHHVPAGSSVRYVLDADDVDTPIRLVIGDRDQVQLEMGTGVARSIVAALHDAGYEVHASGEAAVQVGRES